MTDTTWQIYHGGTEQTEQSRVDAWLDNPPPWRGSRQEQGMRDRDVPNDERATQRGERFVCVGDDLVPRVNFALMLRRPLLVTGEPGLGKSTLAYNIAHCLGLGTPLRWEINSRTTLKDGLYDYDAVDRLRESQAPQSGDSGDGGEDPDVGRFFRLGPLGTALYPWERPRVLLIDELDKASYDLPNDLLHVFEEGRFKIPELGRVKAANGHEVRFHDQRQGESRLSVRDDEVITNHHPVVVITSNGEREFSPAFLRRCVDLELKRPDDTETLHRIVKCHFPDAEDERVTAALKAFEEFRTDELLQAFHLTQKGAPQGQVENLVKKRDG